MPGTFRAAFAPYTAVGTRRVGRIDGPAESNRGSHAPRRARVPVSRSGGTRSIEIRWSPAFPESCPLSSARLIPVRRASLPQPGQGRCDN